MTIRGAETATAQVEVGSVLRNLEGHMVTAANRGGVDSVEVVQEVLDVAVGLVAEHSVEV